MDIKMSSENVNTENTEKAEKTEQNTPTTAAGLIKQIEAEMNKKRLGAVKSVLAQKYEKIAEHERAVRQLKAEVDAELKKFEQGL
jgi:NAD-dependent DNA ligase